MTEPLTWAQFRSLFESHYIPSAAKKKKAEEFLRLQQGSGSVTEYSCKYRRLEKYGKPMEEHEQIEKFIDGL